MKIYVTEDYQSMSRKAANILSAQVILNPTCVLGLATGSSPVGMYKQLIEWYKRGDVDFSEVRTVNLDEYVGLAPDHDQSYRYFMQSNFFDHINIKPENTNLPNGQAADLAAECKRYNQVIHSQGGIDMQLLGMGHNGHIGFNEPSDTFDLETHVVDRAHHRRQRPLLRHPQRGAPSGSDHGHQDHHAGPENSGGGQRRGQGGRRQGGSDRPRHPQGSRLDSPAASQCHAGCR